MNKKLLIILLVGLVLVAGFTFVYAKHISKEGRPIKMKARGLEGSIETLPVPQKRVLQITRDDSRMPKSLDDLKNAMGEYGMPYVAPEEVLTTQYLADGTSKIMTPQGILEEMALTECVVYPQLGSTYWQPWPDYFDAYINCVGTYELYVYQDPQFDPVNSACGYPVYPFEVSGAQYWVATPGSCTVVVQFDVARDKGTPLGYGMPFPDWSNPDWSSGPLEFFLPEAGSYYLTATIPELERPCYHVPFFTLAMGLNSDDFTEGSEPERCGPDTTKYGFWITSNFDQSARKPHSFYYNDLIGGYYHMSDVKGGMYEVRAIGFTRDQNECELESLWYHKAGFGDWECSEPIEQHLELCVVDTTPAGDTIWGSYRLVTPVDYGYAPDGMPDFHQVDPYMCGPAALSNCLWWCFAGGFPWYAVTNWYGAWDPSIPPMMMAELAACMNTDQSGTDVYDMQQCILDLNEQYGFWLTETTIVQPTFEDIEYQIRLSQDVILLLGFWYFDVEAEQWFRLGGHYVTCSGTNWEFFLLSFSDPMINGHCDFGHPGDSSGGVFIPHNHPCDPPCHFDAGNVSHDYYQIALDSPSPGGILWIPYYEYYDEALYGMNFTPELEPFMAPGPIPQYEIVTEIEYAVVICPGSPFSSNALDSWNVRMYKTNYGEEGPGFVNWNFGTDELFEGSILLGTSGDDLGIAMSNVGEDIKFFPYGPIEQDYRFHEHMLIDTMYAKYHHDAGLPLDVEMFAIGIDPGGWECIGLPCGDLVIQKFVITNTGDATIEDLEWGLFLDWDVNLPDPNTSFGGGDSSYNTGFAYDSTFESDVEYTTLVPSIPGKISPSYQVFVQQVPVYDAMPGPYDSLKTLMELPYWDLPDKTPVGAGVFDYGYLMTSEKFSLDPGEKTIQEYIIWIDTQIPSTDYAAYRHKLYQLLRLAGYYRGDVGDFSSNQGSPGVTDITDIVYLVNWLWKGGPDPRPFIDQGDVDCDGETKVEDVVYLTRYILRSSGIPPIDKNRFIDETYKILFSRPSLCDDPQWNSLGAP